MDLFLGIFLKTQNNERVACHEEGNTNILNDPIQFMQVGEKPNSYKLRYSMEKVYRSSEEYWDFQG